jgi:hypothetical protein
LFIIFLLPIQTILTCNHQGVRAAAGSSSATPPTSSTTTSNQPSEVFFYLYILSVKHPISHLFCSNKWVHRQAYQALKLLNQQVSMPPSQLSLRSK